MLAPLLSLVIVGLAPLPETSTPPVHVTRLGAGRVQPSIAVNAGGSLHVACLAGPAKASEVEYLKRAPGKSAFDAPLRVNSIPGSAIAFGAIRGVQMAVGRDGRVHVIWNGSAAPAGKEVSSPLWYTRLDPAARAFEPERNLVGATRSLDGGATIAADHRGSVTIAWHGAPSDSKDTGETARTIFATRSTDDGKTFAPETCVDTMKLGACACCAMGSVADAAGRVTLIYRAARQDVGRDVIMLRSDNAPGAPLSFSAQVLDQWRIGACPMTSCGLALLPGDAIAIAWETKGQVWSARAQAGTNTVSKPFPAPDEPAGRKHPRIAVNAKGQTLLVWTEGAGSQPGGIVRWQLYDEKDQPITGASGRESGLPAWSFAAAAALPDGSFEVIF